MYNPVELIVPSAVEFRFWPGSDQVTFWLVDPVTAAVNCTVPPAGAVTYPLGVTVTV